MNALAIIQLVSAISAALPVLIQAVESVFLAQRWFGLQSVLFAQRLIALHGVFLGRRLCALQRAFLP